MVNNERSGSQMDEKDNNVEKDKKDEKKVTKKVKTKKIKAISEYKLVLWMLSSLTLLLLLLIVIPLIAPLIGKELTEIIEYCKWIVPALLGAFGAWIGAGAAYFFGKENMMLNNESTQKALETQQKMSKMSALIKDINLTPFNPHFLFNLNSLLNDVLSKLDENVDYWFVPILDTRKEKIIDIIHTEALWRYKVENPKNKTEEELRKVNISDIIDFIMDKPPGQSSKLRGFYTIVKMDYKIEDVLNEMNRTGANVGIVCNDNDKPTHCFSRKDLQSFMIGS
jgi:CBS domain containing-hemolysin-like protein